MPRGKQKNRERSKTNHPDNINLLNKDKYKTQNNCYKGKSRASTRSSTRSSPDNKNTDTNIECINNNVLENGYITKRFTSGDRFEGNYSEGKRNGYGLYIWLNCDKYTGNYMFYISFVI
jgi:hypothetical protein